MINNFMNFIRVIYYIYSYSTQEFIIWPFKRVPA